jgi:RHS repeat-associated protein
VGYVDSTFTYAPNGGCSLHLRGETCSGYVTASQVGSATSYVYDSIGNRKDSPTAVGSIDSGNRLRRLGTLRMDYDPAGNLLAKRTLNASDTTQVLRRDSLFWSALGRLDSVHTRDSQGTLTRVGFGYDGWGRRVRKTASGITTRFLWDGGALLMDLDSAGNRVAEYTYYPGADNPHSVLRHDRGDTTFYYVKDLPGNITGLVKRTATGVAVADQYDYTPFGDLATGSAPVPNRLLYAAREYDGETQLYYNRARYYDPAVGRFVSEDPAGLSAGINLYAYAGNDPLNGRDPSGLCSGSSGASSGSGDKDRSGPARKKSYVACLAAAADAWLQQNYGFGLQDALNGTSGDCLFSGGGSITCSAGGFSYGGAQFSGPGALIFLRSKAFNHCNASSAYGNMYEPLLPSGDMAVLTYNLERVGRKRWVPGEIPGDEGSFEAHYKGTFRLVSIWTPETQNYKGGIWVNCASNSGWFQGQLVP